MKAILTESHETRWLEQGWLLLLFFQEGAVPFRIVDREWSQLKPYSLGYNLAAGSNFDDYLEIQDAQNRRYLEPYKDDFIYHTFWGVTPSKVRIYYQYPPRTDIGGMVSAPRTTTGDVGYVDGEMSPYEGPYSPKTELFTIKERYPLFQAYNPLNDSIYQVKLAFDQMRYTYEIIKDKPLIKEMLVGNRRVKKYTMGSVDKLMTIPNWLEKLVGTDILKYTIDVMEGRA